jgi:CRISPR-associated protein Cas2
MHLIVIYDISNDRIRGKVADACQDYGLDRIQYSAFYGQLQRTHQEELMLRVAALLKKEPGRIQLIPINEKDWQKRLEVGQWELPEGQKSQHPEDADWEDENAGEG